MVIIDLAIETKERVTHIPRFFLLGFVSCIPTSTLPFKYSNIRSQIVDLICQMHYPVSFDQSSILCQIFEHLNEIT